MVKCDDHAKGVGVEGADCWTLFQPARKTLRENQAKFQQV
jgi:hypothetical protein